jgi:hypothetical protein
MMGQLEIDPLTLKPLIGSAGECADDVAREGLRAHRILGVRRRGLNLGGRTPNNQPWGQCHPRRPTYKRAMRLTELGS